MIGEGTDLFRVDMPPSLYGKTLWESGIGTGTGLNVVAIDSANGMIANPPSETRLEAGGQLVMIGTMEQRATFAQEHER